MGDTDATELVKGAYAAIAKGDIKGFFGVFDENMEVHEPACLPYGGSFKGTREVMGMFGNAGPYLDSAKMVVEKVFGDGEDVAAVLRIPLRDGSAEALILEHWRFEHGKAVELRVFWSDPTIVTAA